MGSDGLVRVYELECMECGHLHLDSIRWVSCLRKGCSGKYKVVKESFGGV